MPPPRSPITDTSRSTSFQSATREATGRSSDVSWLLVRDVVKPMAPARMASRSSRSMATSSSSVACSEKARSPIAQVRSAEWPTLAA
ncbi:MAG: hypothetical protein R2749_17135 [Acidimicrobiales bacterium]